MCPFQFGNRERHAKIDGLRQEDDNKEPCGDVGSHTDKNRTHGSLCHNDDIIMFVHWIRGQIDLGLDIVSDHMSDRPDPEPPPSLPEPEPPPSQLILFQFRTISLFVTYLGISTKQVTR